MLPLVGGKPKKVKEQRENIMYTWLLFIHSLSVHLMSGTPLNAEDIIMRKSNGQCSTRASRIVEIKTLIT